MSLQAQLAAYAQKFPGIPIAAARIDGDRAEVAYLNCDATTRFEIGSITKVITAILLCEAVEAGQCKLDDPLKKHLPQARRVPGFFGKKITLEHLARQTSGMPRLPRSMYFKDVYTSQPYATWDRKRLIRALSSTILKTPPGSTYAYSNFGFAILGLALEKITGKPYGELVSNLTTRLSCPDLRLPEPTDAALNAPGHAVNGRPVEAWNLAAFAPAGGCTSTLEALADFARANLTNPTPSMKEAMSNRKRISNKPPFGSGVLLTIIYAALLVAATLFQSNIFIVPVLLIELAAFAAGWLGAGIATLAWVLVGVSQHATPNELWSRLAFGAATYCIALYANRKKKGVVEMGLGWHVAEVNGQPVCWHNGGTAGFRSYLGFQAETGKAVVVLAGQANSVDALGLQLLKD